MTWQKYLTDWKTDKNQPMTHPKIDTSYAKGRLDLGRRYVKHLGIDLRGKKVLDVAIGSGGIACAFAEAGALVYGLDINNYFIKMSKARFKDLNLKYEEIREWYGVFSMMPYVNNSFDFIICTDTLEHSPRWRLFVEEMCHALKDGGHILLTTERRIFPYFIYKNPHDDLPFTILLPHSLREFIDTRLLHKPSLDYHFFSFSGELIREFRKHGVQMRAFDDVKRERFEEIKYPKWSWFIYNQMFITLLGTKEPFVLDKLPWDAVPP